ncbi:DegV family protein [Ethanoligenens sp.]|uniref:DegV family protein n=1 Tax=Ethanoligenens sp. TaxID=2099655 RepID=UPI0039EC3362
MDFVLLTDSTCDLSPQMAEELAVSVIPLIYSIDGKEYYHYVDNRELNIHMYYDQLRAGAYPQTAQISPLEFREAFEPHLRAGKDVLYIAFSSGISGTYNTAAMVAKELQTEYPDRRMIVYDSLCASGGEGLLVYHAAKLAQTGQPLDTVLAWLDENRTKLVHWFTVDDLNHLHRGGRITGAAALVGGMLGIKPVLHVDDEGRLIPMEKVRGRRKALDRLVDHMIETAVDPVNQTVFINHADCMDDARYVEKQVRARVGATDIHLYYIGPLIGAHSGPGTLALFFLGSKR